MTQLFPTIAPYNVQNARAQSAYQLLGQEVSQYAEQLRASGNTSQFYESIAYTPYDVAGFSYPNTSTITWPELYGPEQYHGDNFTNLFGRRYFDPLYTMVAGGIVVSGYGNRSSLPQQVFQSENIILVSNGACDSACAIFVHFLKYQGKVKQIAIGGRPQEGPMQPVGGTRGTQDEPLKRIFEFTAGIEQQATPQDVAQLNKTELATIDSKGSYVLSRAINYDGASVNLYNHIAQNDTTLTPLQFTYEAADCRIFYTAETAVNVSASWAKIADVWKGGLADCIAGSTGQPSSLSGNAQLYNGGVPSNVSTFEIPANTPNQNGTGTSGNAAATYTGSAVSVSQNTVPLLVVATLAIGLLA